MPTPCAIPLAAPNASAAMPAKPATPSAIMGRDSGSSSRRARMYRTIPIGVASAPKPDERTQRFSTGRPLSAPTRVLTTRSSRSTPAAKISGKSSVMLWPPRRRALRAAFPRFRNQLGGQIPRSLHEMRRAQTRYGTRVPPQISRCLRFVPVRLNLGSLGWTMGAPQWPTALASARRRSTSRTTAPQRPCREPARRQRPERLEEDRSAER